MTTYTINEYTGAWQSALTPRQYPADGDTIRVAYDTTPDGREWDDFRRALDAVNGTIEFEYAEDGYDVYTVSAPEDTEEEL